MAVIILLSLMCIFLLCYALFLKSIIREIKKELILTREASYNRQVQIPLVDNDMTEMAAELNRNLEYQKRLKLEAERNEIQLKKSVSDIAHDLRTPLTVILGNLQLLEKAGEIGEQDRQRVAVCMKKAQALKEMADDFFDLSVLESESAQTVFSKVNLTSYLMEFLIEHETMITEHGLEPEIIFPEKTVFISADEQMLGRMFSNLLNNIIKYAEGRFFIKLEETADRKCRVTFGNPVAGSRVFDTEHLFDRSYRGDKARSGGGAGLGLYIVKLLAEKQNGSVTAVRENDLLSVTMTFNIMN